MGEMILLYDGDCGVCRWSVTRIVAWDRAHRVRAAPLQGEEAARLLVDVAVDQRMASAHVVSPNGRVYSGGAMADPLLRSLPGGRPLAALARAMPRATEHAYRLVAGNRDRLGRRLGVNTCSPK
ncbi:MAG: thiol-disulfide oxidoreductase DCC family protein [Actinomycetota bacterium]